MALGTFRTSTSQSASFKLRMFIRRTRTRIALKLLHMLEGDVRATS